MKAKDLNLLRKKEIVELKKEKDEKKKELALAYADLKAGKEKNLKKVKNLRHDIAQTLTVIREKEIIAKRKDK